MIFRLGSRSVRNPPRQFGGHSFDYQARAALPAGAESTGWRQGARELWVSPADLMLGLNPPPYSHVYVRYPDHVERWPQFPFGCM